MRVINRIQNLYPNLSRKKIKELILQGVVFSHHRKIKLSDKVDQEIEITIDPQYLLDHLIPNPNLKCRVVFENNSLFVIEKPMNLHSVAHSFLDQNTVANWLLSINEDLDKVSSPLESGLIQRLDYETSGLMIVAKNQKSYLYLKNQLKEDKIEKYYQCLIKEPIEPDLYEIYFDEHSKNRKKVRLIDDDLFEIEEKYLLKTDILSCEKLDDQYLLTIKLITGFRHQIRAHLNYLGSSIIGDVLYGGSSADQLFLHAHKLVFKDIDHQMVKVESEPLWIK